MIEKQIDTRLPLVADYCSAMVNVSIQIVDKDKKTGSFYGLTFDDIESRIAQPILDYVTALQAALSKMNGDVTYSCNCMLNFLYSSLEGKKSAHMTGGMTFGEVAYLFLNQSMVYMVVETIIRKALNNSTLKFLENARKMHGYDFMDIGFASSSMTAD